MFTVYVLRSLKDGGLYVGQTNDLKRRIAEHNKGLSVATKSRRPFVLIYSENCIDRKQARVREKFWKMGYNREKLRVLP